MVHGGPVIEMDQSFNQAGILLLDPGSVKVLSFVHLIYVPVLTVEDERMRQLTSCMCSGPWLEIRELGRRL